MPGNRSDVGFGRRCGAGIVAAALVVATVTNGAAAGPLKDVMGEMGATAKHTKRLLAGSFDLAAAQAILGRYAALAGRADGLFEGRSDPRSRDMRARFGQLQRLAARASGTVADGASFRQAFGTIAQSCRSCHDAYK
jgi:cytochrome c556